jgi:hypothetical protein
VSRETIYRYECSICLNHDYAINTPIGWSECWVSEDGEKPDIHEVSFLCPDHTKALLEGIPSRLLHPRISVTRGTATPLDLKTGRERYPPVFDRT